MISRSNLSKIIHLMCPKLNLDEAPGTVIIKVDMHRLISIRAGILDIISKIGPQLLSYPFRRMKIFPDGYLGIKPSFLKKSRKIVRYLIQ